MSRFGSHEMVISEDVNRFYVVPMTLFIEEVVSMINREVFKLTTKAESPDSKVVIGNLEIQLIPMSDVYGLHARLIRRFISVVDVCPPSLN